MALSSPPTVNTTSSNTQNKTLFYTFNIGLICMISIVNIIGNTLVIQSVLRHKNLNIPSNYFILSLAVSDLFLGLIYPIYNISHMELEDINNVLGDWEFCTIISIFTLGGLFWSSYNLVGITITRYLCIQNPLTIQEKMTKGRTLVGVLAVAFTSLIVSMFEHLRLQAPENYGQICRYELVFNIAHVVFNTIFSYVIPVALMAVLYGHMAIIAKSKIETMGMLHTNSKQLENARKVWILKKEMKLFGVAGILIGYFTLAWLPYIIFEILSTCYSPDAIDDYIRATVRILLHSNSAVNVLIYGGRLKEFRSAIRNDIHNCLPCCFKDRFNLMAYNGMTADNTKE